MDEKPKNFWKKPWKGSRGLLLWLTTLFAGAFFIFISLEFVFAGQDSAAELTKFAAISAFGCVLAFLAIAFIHWLFCWRNFRRFLFGLACFATLVALFYAEEDWRGKYDWEKYKLAEEARGEKFDFQDFIPPTVPDDRNFALAPIFDYTDKMGSRKWREAHRNRQPQSGGNQSAWDTNLVDPLAINVLYNDSSSPPNGVGNWATDRRSDLKPWQEYFRALAAKTNIYPVAPQPQTPAQDVLLALSKYDSAINGLRQAAELPFSRFPLDYDDENPGEILLPELGEVKRCSQVLQLRAIAELQNGQAGEALDDIKLSLRLADSVRTEPFIISQLVRIAIFQIAQQPIWEGLSRHQWSDAQLADLDSNLPNPDFLAGYLLSVRSEVAGHIKLIDYVDQKRSRYFELWGMVSNMNSPANSPYSMENLPTMIGLYLMPKGWFDQNKVVLAERQLRFNLLIDDGQQLVSPKLGQSHVQNDNELYAHPTPFNFLARLLLSNLESFAKKVAYAQTSVNLARIAVALERYRLAHGEFPESLDPLAPQFMSELPHDIINGQPLHYRRTADGQFVLYSIGWNETDDGGVVVMKKNSKDVNRDQGDWVWRYPSRN